MGIRDVAGVFSRYFVVGFFLPFFFAAAALDQITHGSLFPREYRHVAGTRLLIIGGLSILGGLVLTGLHRSVLSALSGEVLWPAPLRRKAIAHHRYRYGRLIALVEDGSASAERTAAAFRLATTYPANAEAILPTRLGNARRAPEWQAIQRWSLDPTVAWPRIKLMLDDRQMAQLADARTDLAFLVNGCVLAAVTDVCAVTWLTGHSSAIVTIAAAAITALVARVMYLLAVPTALRVGAEVQGAAIDLLRLDLYKRLGLRQPATEEEDRVIGRAANRLLAFGEATPDAISVGAGGEDNEPPAQN